VFLKCGDGKFGSQRYIVEAQGTVTGRGQKMGGVDFRVCQVIQGVVGRVPKKMLDRRAR
jgi:hypothetical protein